MNSTEDMVVHHRSCLFVSACDIVCVTGHVCVVVHAVWGDVSRVKCQESRV